MLTTPSNVTVLRLGFGNESFPQCLYNMKTLSNCEDMNAKLLYFWLRLWWHNESTVKFFMYPVPFGENYNNTMLNDLRNGLIDIAPEDYSLDEEFSSNFSIITQLDNSGFSFYTSKPEYEENGFLFLLAPFKWDLWLAFVFVTVILFCLLQLFKKFETLGICPHFHYKTFFYACCIITESVFLCLYSSNLKSLLTTPRSKLPFSDLYDLAYKIEKGEKKIVLEQIGSERYSLLTNGEVDKPDVFKYLEMALKRNPSSLLIIENVSELCEILSHDKNFVYFSYKSLIDVECVRFCFWEYIILELPVTPASILMTINSPYYELANMARQSYENYKLNILRESEMPVVNCEKKVADETTNLFIGFNCLYGALCVYCIFAGVGIIILMLEMFCSKYFICF